jgi:hypothetical protein
MRAQKAAATNRQIGLRKQFAFDNISEIESRIEPLDALLSELQNSKFEVLDQLSKEISERYLEM